MVKEAGNVVLDVSMFTMPNICHDFLLMTEGDKDKFKHLQMCLFRV